MELFIMPPRNRNNKQLAMRPLRYPIEIADKGTPFILFTAHKALYKKGATVVQKVDNKSCALYMPPGFQVADIMRYEGAAPGFLGKILEQGVDALGGGGPAGQGGGIGDYSMEDIKDVASTFAGTAAQGVVGLASAKIGGMAAGILGAVGSNSIGASIDAIRAKKQQTGLNPQEFMFFKAPNARQFGFTFNFLPRSEAESDAVINIIKYFRTRMYPTVAANDLMYKFPEVFTIGFRSIDDHAIPKIAESALTNTTIVYNPNTMSFFKSGNRPVEVAMTLSFQELMPLTQENIAQGGF